MCLCPNQFFIGFDLSTSRYPMCVLCVLFIYSVSVCVIYHIITIFHWLRLEHFQVQLSGGRKGKILINTMSSTHRGGYGGRDFKGRPFAKPLSRDYYDDGVGPLRRRFSHEVHQCMQLTNGRVGGQMGPRYRSTTRDCCSSPRRRLALHAMLRR